MAKQSPGSLGPDGRNQSLSMGLKQGPFAQAPWRPRFGLRGKGWDFLRRPQSLLCGLTRSAIRFQSGSEGNREVAAAMEAAEEDAGGTAGAGGGLGGPEDQRGTGGPNSHGSPGLLEDHGGPGGPSSSGGLDTQSGLCRPPDRGGPGTPKGQGGPDGPRCQGDPGDEETMGSAAIGAPSVARAAHTSEPASVSVGPGNRKIALYPFQRAPEARWPRDGSGTSRKARVWLLGTGHRAARGRQKWEQGREPGVGWWEGSRHLRRLEGREAGLREWGSWDEMN